jgi:hypothetical protein
LALIFITTTGILIGCFAKTRLNFIDTTDYHLPDLFLTRSGDRVSDAKSWREIRRPEIIELYEDQVYGRAPGRPAGMTFHVFESDPQALSGRATRKQVRVDFTGNEGGPGMDILIYLPNQVKKPAPVFILLNFFGNHTVNSDPKIALPHHDNSGKGGKGFSSLARGIGSLDFPIKAILERGYGLVTINCEDIAPNSNDGFKKGVHGAFDSYGGAERPGNAWGTIAAWAWGLSRAMDYIETDPEIDHERVAVLGHSRLGKAAVWAGAKDERFAMVISNCSGCGGAALFRRISGETIKDINTNWPQWFCENFHRYNGREEDLPVDQHMLLALIAPRPLYVASAVKDNWADPTGEFLSTLHADPVYKMMGAEGLPVKEIPPINQPVMGTIGYHIRKGGHALTPYDWEQYMNFADLHYSSRTKPAAQ